MLVVGLTGGIASGKSTVSRIFQEAGVPVICADELAREAVQPGAAALEKIRREFGAGVIDAEGGLDRVRMAEVVFQDRSKREALENIIHPEVAAQKDRRIEQLTRSGHSLAIVDVPLLYEKGWEGQFDLVIVVHVPRAIQERRLVERDHMSPDEARSRLDAQMPIDDKKARAHSVIDNSGSPERTREQVTRLLGELRDLAKAKDCASCQGSVAKRA